MGPAGNKRWGGFPPMRVNGKQRYHSATDECGWVLKKVGKASTYKRARAFGYRVPHSRRIGVIVRWASVPPLSPFQGLRSCLRVRRIHQFGYTLATQDTSPPLDNFSQLDFSTSVKVTAVQTDRVLDPFRYFLSNATPF
ncbi:unnamed protein product, partial [Ectocarpus sp. 4 AP-2014]